MKKEKKVWALTLLAFWSLSPNLLKAQQNDSPDSVRTLNEVVISATRQEQPLIEVPRSITVISQDLIERSVHQSVGDLLASQAGVYVIGATQTPGTNQSVFLRGANSNQVVILIDGVRVTDPTSPNGTIDLSEISLAGVERIEILRGSHSTVYGGSAIGGVINIITKAGKMQGFHGTASLQGGTLGDGSATGNGLADVSYRHKSGVYVTAGVFTQRVNGLNATIDTVTTETFKTADKDDFVKTDGTVKIGYKNNGWDVLAGFRHSDQRADIDDRSFDDDDNAYLDFERKILEYRAAYRFSDKWNLSLNGAWSPSTRYLENDSSINDYQGNYDKTVSRASYEGKTTTHELLLNYKHQALSFTFGGGRYDEKMNFNTYYYSNAFGSPFELRTNYDSINTSAETKYGFVQGALQLKRWRITAGSRLSNHSLFGNNWTFEFSPSYSFLNTLFYASVSSGYNAPSLYQLFDPTLNFGSNITRGNRKLRPETSLSFELGLKKEYDDGSYFTISTFRSNVENIIEYVYLWNKDTPIEEVTYLDYVTDLYLNLASQTTYGIEVTGRIVRGRFYALGNLSWVDGHIRTNPSDIRTEETGGHHVQLYNHGPFVTGKVDVESLVRRPVLTGFGEVGYDILKNLTINAALRHAGSRNDVEYDAALGPYGALAQNKVDRYNLLDIGVMYRINHQLLLTARVENILDEKYREIYGFQTRGRGGYLKLTFRW